MEETATTVTKITNSAELQEIRNDLNALKTNVVTLAQDLKNGGGTVARQSLDSLKAAGQDEFQKIEEFVQEKPAQSLALAFCAGLVFSALISRR